MAKFERGTNELKLDRKRSIRRLNLKENMWLTGWMKECHFVGGVTFQEGKTTQLSEPDHQERDNEPEGRPTPRDPWRYAEAESR